ncbi:MAG: hypothetical protein M1823_005065 [Watsoniomyces obsoletus]|nr:MAG: hypothetical protein M1823_005065 [Watsoniomyces obsoletus]
MAGLNFWSLTKEFHHDIYPGIDPKRPENSLKGKNVVVVGASRGIGAAIALAMAQAGADHVVITARKTESLHKEKEDIEKAGAKCTEIAADIADHNAIDKAFAQIAKEVGPVHACVTNAGVTLVSSITEADMDEFWKIFEINTKGSLAVMRALAKHNPKGATLISINSCIGHLSTSGWVNNSAYAGSKAATAKVHEYFQAENPQFKVFSVHPGIIATDMSAGVMHTDDLPDTAKLPAGFCVWLASGQGDAFKGKFLWASWDVEELKQREKELLAEEENLTIALQGWKKL